MKVRCYFNLHRRKYSIQRKTPKGWRVYKHTDLICLEDARFIVSAAGRRRVLAEQKKNVHAYVEGTLANPFKHQCNGNQLELEGITYNPYKCGNFVFRDNGVVLHNSPLVIGSVHNRQPQLFAADPHLQPSNV